MTADPHPLRPAAPPAPLLRVALAVLLSMSLCGVAAAQAQTTPLAANWWDRTAPPRGGALPTSRHYTIRSDLQLEQTRAFADHLDTMFVEYARRLASLPQRFPHVLNVFMFERRQDYAETLRTQFGIDATGSGGMFFVTPRGAGLAFFVEGVPRTRILHVIQHEGFHQFAFSRFGNDLPIWVNEGLAEFFGFAAVVGGEVVIGQSSPWTLDALRSAIERNATIAFLEMLTMTNEGWNARVRTRQGAMQYQQAWSMVHFLIFGEGGRYRGAFERYLRLLNTGMPSEPAFVQAFGSDDLAAFETRWRAHVAVARPGAFVAALERMEFIAAGLLVLEREGKRPETIEAIREALVEMEFTFTLERHGYSITLRADDPQALAIPEDEHTRQPPHFVAERIRPTRLTIRERRLEEERPSPAIVRTQHLRPREIALRWVRTEAGDFRYEIETR